MASLSTDFVMPLVQPGSKLVLRAGTVQRFVRDPHNHASPVVIRKSASVIVYRGVIRPNLFSFPTLTSFTSPCLGFLPPSSFQQTHAPSEVITPGKNHQLPAEHSSCPHAFQRGQLFPGASSQQVFGAATWWSIISLCFSNSGVRKTQGVDPLLNSLQHYILIVLGHTVCFSLCQYLELFFTQTGLTVTPWYK